MTPQIESLKNLFTFEKFRQTLEFYWSLYWRCLLLISPIFLSIGPIYMFQEDIISSSWLSYCIIGLCIVETLLMFPLIAYVLFKIITSKDYKSFDKVFLNEKFSKFWSWSFWKVFLMFLGVSVMILVPIFFANLLLNKMMIRFFTENLYVRLFFMALFSYVLNLTMYHITLHKGLFGFIPVSKKK